MSWVYFVRIVGPTFLLAGWVVYQLFIRGKKWKEVRNDAFAAGFFALTWVCLTWVFTS